MPSTDFHVLESKLKDLDSDKVGAINHHSRVILAETLSRILTIDKIEASWYSVLYSQNGNDLTLRVPMNCSDDETKPRPEELTQALVSLLQYLLRTTYLPDSINSVGVWLLPSAVYKIPLYVEGNRHPPTPPQS